MKSFVASSIVKLLPKGIIYRIERPLRKEMSTMRQYFSVNGEDIVLKNIFKNPHKGYYVDIGAYHPINFSNTYALYLRGWRGLNIDAMPGSMKLFEKFRPEDKNIEIGVSDKDEVMKFFIFNEPALNTFNKEMANERNGKDKYKIVKTIDLETMPLCKILDKYVAPDTVIDYLNIDIEGLDLQVLRSNNWEKYKPSVISVESNYVNGPIQMSEIYSYLTRLDYRLISVVFNTLIFTRPDSDTHSVLYL